MYVGMALKSHELGCTEKVESHNEPILLQRSIQSDILKKSMVLLKVCKAI